MKLFDYRSKKDLQGKTTDFRSGASANPPPTARPSRPPQPDPTRRKQPASRNRVMSRNRDKWVYNQKLEEYRSVGPSSQNNPNLPQQTGESKSEYDERYSKYRKLLPEWFSGEVIKFVFRRHWMHIFFIGRFTWILLPITIIATIVGLLLPFLIIVPVVLWVIQLMALAWVINDWLNDYLIVTDRRIIDLEKVSFFNSVKTEIPLDKVQEVKIVTKRGTIDYLFRVGTVTISSSGRTSITFNHLRDPERIRKEWTNLKRSYFMARTAFRKDRMTNYLENKIWGTPLVNWNSTEEDRALQVTENPSWFQKTVPFGPQREGNDIIWHTHPWILVKKIFPLLIVFPLILIGSLIGLPFLLAFNPLLGGIALFIAILVLLFMGFFIWFRYDDWHNDRYIMSVDKIVDIVKMPFGFDETQSVVEIRNVQDTEYEKRGFIANWFNFGTVRVTTIGGPALTFNNIPDPQIVEDEVSRRKEMLKFIDEERQDRLTADFFATYRDILLHPEDHAPSSPNDAKPGRLDDPPRR